MLFLISYFEFQLQHLISLGKPLFLHNRAASQDLYEILYKYREKIKTGGVVS
jgi:Tat protein secretion system quality control protein TatD with DNase activity